MLDSERLWAITSYYNPARYERRLKNYREFRRRLQTPLVTVELGYDGIFDLGPADADILIRISGTSVLWQKERLLNIALANVPENVPWVAWIDCDVVFERRDWQAQAVALLADWDIIQLFDVLTDLGCDMLPQDGDMPITSGVSIASMMATQTYSQEDLRPSTTKRFRKCLCGLAWAGRRSLLAAHGFYDAMILGSGDRAMACAAYGKYDDAIAATRLSPCRASHYLAWAKPYCRRLGNKVGVLGGRLFHLWHGELVHRKYAERHADLATLDFDPSVDIAISESGCWEWASNKPALHAYVKSHMLGRKEDGASAT